MTIRDRLAGARLLLTGVTGFVGQALLERLLATVPDLRVVLLVRPKGTTSAEERVRRLLSGAAVFAQTRERLGEDAVDRLLARIEIVSGDVSDAPGVLTGTFDVVVHCAGNVSFDPPIDEAFETNLLGVEGLYRTVAELGSPHIVHVSTAYVAGMTKGVIPEASLEHDVDWRVEADAALAARREVEHASRRPALLNRLMEEARDEHSRAGPQAVAAAAEEARREWVSSRLVEHGRARARSLGWPDVYTLTKALGERCAEEVCADVSLSVVRPSIIESALAHPEPGWIEGFKMAEPIILGFGRGEIPDFPGVPDGIVDIIPVDLVADALVAIAAHPPAAGDSPAYYHVCSGSRNPLRFQELYELVRDYFVTDPLPGRDGSEVAVPEWRFRGSERVLRLLRTGERLVEAADSVVSRLPRSDRVRDAARTVDRHRRRLEFVRRYADLYGPYVETEVIYTDDRALELFRGLEAEDQEEFRFDAARIDWAHYFQEVHCPSVTALLRIRRPRRRRSGPSAPPEDGDRATIAAFDMDGTIIQTNVIESYLWMRMAELDGGGWTSEFAAVARDMPRLMAAELRARETFLRTFYRRYEGADIAALQRLVDDEVGEVLLRRVAPAALRRVRQHRAAGHRTVLITGALDLLTVPLAPLFDEIVAAELAVDRDGTCTGFLTKPPLVGEARAAWLRRYALRVGGALGRSHAYADSHSDLPLLEAVGNPVAVNPDVSLFRKARSRRWPVERWRTTEGTPRLIVPDNRARSVNRLDGQGVR